MLLIARKTLPRWCWCANCGTNTPPREAPNWYRMKSEVKPEFTFGLEVTFCSEQCAKDWLSTASAEEYDDYGVWDGFQ